MIKLTLQHFSYWTWKVTARFNFPLQHVTVDGWVQLKKFYTQTEMFL